MEDQTGTPREALIHQKMAEAGSAYKVSEMLREGGGQRYRSTWGLTDGGRLALLVFTDFIQRLEHGSHFPFISNL